MHNRQSILGAVRSAGFIVLVLSATLLNAEKVKGGFYFSQDLGASLNPLGALSTSRLFYRVPLLQMDGILWESTKVEIGVKNYMSPAYDTLGVSLDIEPIAVFDISFFASFYCGYKALGFGFVDLPDYNAPFSGAAFDAIPQRDNTGIWIHAAPRFKIELGPVIFANTFTVTYVKMNGAGYFYERYINAVLKFEDYSFQNDTYAFYKINNAFMAGVNHWYLYVPNSGYVSQRIAGVGVYSTKFGDNLEFYGVFMLGTFLRDRYYQYTLLYTAIQAGITLKL